MMDSFDAFLSWWQDAFGVREIKGNHDMMASAIYLQVSTISQALIFVTRSRGWSFLERPGLLLVTAFIIAQMVCTRNQVLFP